MREDVYKSLNVAGTSETARVKRVKGVTVMDGRDRWMDGGT